jgi:hypothetical protein
MPPLVRHQAHNPSSNHCQLVSHQYHQKLVFALCFKQYNNQFSAKNLIKIE